MSFLNLMKIHATDTLAATLIAGFLVVIPAPLRAQQQGAAAPNSAVKTAHQVDEENEMPSAKKPSGDGIKVHGHWIIDVKDKDGKLLEHRDFQNALQPAGGNLLGALLTGQVVPDQLYVVVGGGSSNGYQISGTTSLAAAACTSAGAAHCATGLTQQLATGGLTLSGQFQAAGADTLTFVATNLMTCVTRDSSTAVLLSSAVAPAACKAGYQSASPGTGSTPYNTTYPFYFTSKDLTIAPATPLVVGAGQTVQVSVTISFS